MEEKQQNQLNIELSEEVAEGTYSNLAIITHSNSEFVVDFEEAVLGEGFGDRDLGHGHPAAETGLVVLLLLLEEVGDFGVLQFGVMLDAVGKVGVWVEAGVHLTLDSSQTFL